MDTITPTKFRKNLYQELKMIDMDNLIKEIVINNGNEDSGVVLIPKREWNRIQEELYLEQTGTLDVVLDRMESSDESDFV